MHTTGPAAPILDPHAFPGDLWLLEDCYQQWLRQLAGQAITDHERASYNLSLVVSYPSWQQRQDRVLAALRVPRNDRLVVMIEGASRTGKSTFAIEVLLRFLHETREKFGRVWSSVDADDDINPVIAVKGSTGKHADFMRSLLSAVDLPTHGTAEVMLQRFATYSRRHFVRVLLIDDVHVTSSREAGLENFYKRLLDIVPCIIFTAVDFNQSPLPRPGFAPTRRAATLHQLWGRALRNEDPHADPALTFAAEDPGSDAGRRALAGAVVHASKALKLHNQAQSDLTTAAVMQALVALHEGKLGAILSHISQAGASAVGHSERVGSQELGLTITRSADGG